MFLTNPFMSQWLSLANAAAGTMRGHWVGQMHRQQTAMAAEISKQAMRFWTVPLTAQLASKAMPAALEAAEHRVEQLRDVQAQISDQTADAPAPLAASAPVKAAAPPAAQLRSRVERRSTGPAKRKAQTTAPVKRATGTTRSRKQARKSH